jgi:hypothetical protein
LAVLIVAYFYRFPGESEVETGLRNGQVFLPDALRLLAQTPVHLFAPWQGQVAEWRLKRLEEKIRAESARLRQVDKVSAAVEEYQFEDAKKAAAAARKRRQRRRQGTGDSGGEPSCRTYTRRRPRRR